MEKYDVIVIGGGAGGLTVASGASSLGAKVALVEKGQYLGGDCLHVGCVPSKALIQAAKDSYRAKNKATKLGLHVSGEVDMKEVKKRVQASVSTIQKQDSDERFLNMGIDIYRGNGKFTSENTFMIKDTEIYGKRIIIATGSRPFVPKIEGLEEAGYWTNETLFQQEVLPKELLVLGGGPIGLELAQAMARLGSVVTVVEQKDSLLSTEDATIQKAAVKVLESELTFYLNAEVKKVEVQNDKKIVIVDKNGQQIKLAVDEILVAVGRLPNSDSLQLEKIGIEMDERGHILTNEKLQTNLSTIYAIGDVNGKFPFTHVAGEEGKTAVQNAVLGFPKKMKYDQIPWIIYTDPEIFHIGLTEQDAKEKRIAVSIYEIPLAEVDRFVADHEDRGLVKILTNSKGKIVGAHAFGKGAGDWMQTIVFAIAQNHKIGDLSQMVYPYPNHAAAIQRTADLY
ncbi:Pyruvate/2-oxoglutarate dehydrogenase complex, dihydrolipoamide dehydrogenase (E3) component [Carnobacterium iners]|uniref:Pyruvate/2-oxoglutarate dehydrogenase complex, dihydrolipoamide dehydrogenase (E3) component n=1 Tax=Carnobacterium iners TaxID=1073423 RepID=A0A1X7N038_9LACT|nr:FAD-dependent oxidoreductase [Carnobacterium iners]SEK18549.1 Pyruvate/2-oxoglutarate dehydrogenase complex, dihydrolipoamide dehydrogenase (E3) component [Carnobacterium iners]SMH29684.1 Pyruvate/2-oxoglutarate dehydrogenase complex, dihydrolipoamide dehydrogenase (E3) component [Carnobacterium iners]